MKRPVARGRMLPQSLSTDPRYGRLSLKAQVLYPLMWINCDDQGRLSGDPDEIKYAACPSVKEILADDIPNLLQEMGKRNLIKVYTTSRTEAIQMLDWWEVQKLQWAYPSEYLAPEGWQDRLRYHASPTQIVTENWPSKAPNSLPKELPSELPNSLGSKPQSEQLERTTSTARSGEDLLKDIVIWGPPITRDTEPRQRNHKFVLLSFKSVTSLRFDFNESNLVSLVTDIVRESLFSDFPSIPLHKVVETRFGLILGSSFPNWERLFSHIISIPKMSHKCIILESSKEITEHEVEEGSRRGRGSRTLPSSLPSSLGNKSPPSPAGLLTDELEILHKLTECFKKEWGRVPAREPDKVIPREPGARESAQLRDLAKELSAAGGCPLKTIEEAFRDVAGHPGKHHISYVRAVLLAWLGLERGPPA